MTSAVQLRQTVQRTMQQYEPVLPQFPALLGDGRGTVVVSGRLGYVYVRVGAERALSQAFNQRVLPRDDTPIIVGYRSEQPGLFQVLCKREVYAGMGTDDAFTPQIVPHHEIHELENATGGDDVVWVPTQQITALLVYPTDAASMLVNVMPGIYPWGSNWQYYGSGTSADLTSYIPSSDGQSRIVLVSLNGDTNTLQYTSGELYPTDWPPEDFDDKIPAPPSESIPLGGVILASTTTTIGWDELLDLRLWIQVAGGGGGGTGSSAHVVGGLADEVDFQLDQLHLGVPNSTARYILSQTLGHMEAEQDLQMSRHVVEGG